MRRFVLAASACALALAFAAPQASAHPAPGPYYARYGVPYAGGYYYPGAGHHHWSRKVWSPAYHRYHYFDPYRRCDYYWCPQRQAFYPVVR